MIEFSALLSAVKPKERTDQYRILSALFHLQAHVSPVASKQITELLRLHCGNEMPSNVTASLRAYTGYVAPVANGQSKLWTLTSKGVDRLRTLSGLSLATASDSTAFKTDIGIVCALEHPELAALIKVLGGVNAWKEVGNPRFAHVYRETQFTTGKGRALSVVATTSTSMGLTAAAIATTQLILLFRPKIVVMVGIAAGTRSGKKQFGDVLIADPSVDYNSGKVAAADGIRGFLPDPYPIGLNPRLRSVLHKYHGPHPVFANIRKRWSGVLPKEGNRLHVGPLGAADQVIDDATRIEEIQKNWRKLIGVEMETYAVYRSCEEAPEPKPRFVSFKAVCDFAAEKTDSWQDYAAFVAAEFAVEFLRAEWDNLWPSN
ncbi:MAG TPA: hypothetical protein VF773_07775 [Verrucomicrobiae bacterium]